MIEAIAVDYLRPLNEKKFQSFRRRIEQLPLRQRRMLALLTEKEREMSVSELAAWLNVEESAITKHPPLEMIRLGLVSRQRYYEGYRYLSKLRHQLREGFPGADVESLWQRLFP